MSQEMQNSAGDSNDPKAKFREALEKKKKAPGVRKNNIAPNAKIHGDQTSGNAPKMFRRKSGSA